MKIIIYGLGSIQDQVSEYLRQEHEIIGYTDGCSAIEWFHDCRFYLREELKDISFDYIIIAIRGEWGKKATRELVELYEIEEQKIVIFSKLAEGIVPLQRCDMIMSHVMDGRLDGLLFGISHATYGIHAQELSSGLFENLSFFSQDIYYNYKTLEYCYHNYPEKIVNVKTVIFDMYDYTYFNFDTSLSKWIVDYLTKGGIQDVHNADLNVNFPNGVQYELEKRRVVLEEKEKELCQKLFNVEAICGKAYAKEIKYSKRNTKSLIDMKKYDSNVENMYQKTAKRVSTIKENRLFFEKFIELSYKINPQMKIILLLMPCYIERENALKEVLWEWKNEFNTILDEYVKKYQLVYWDFKEYQAISSNPRFYIDSGHLNRIGATAFTSMLNHKMKDYYNL